MNGIGVVKVGVNSIVKWLLKLIDSGVLVTCIFLNCIVKWSGKHYFTKKGLNSEKTVNLYERARQV